MNRRTIKVFLRDHWLLLAIWSLALILRIIVAIISRGYIHADEQFQSIEIVFRKIFGYGYVPWEFQRGIRSWLYPGIVWLIFKTMLFLGCTRIETILIAVRLFSAACSMITVITSYFLGKLFFSKRVGLIATFFVAIWFDFLFWSARTITDSIAMNFAILGVYFFARLLKKRQKKGSAQIIPRKPLVFEAIHGLLAGFAFGLSFMFKFSTVILAIPFLVFLFIERRWKGALFSLLALCCMVLVQGLLDFYTWGGFLQSPIEFFMYNIWTGGSSAHGVSPFLAYLPLMLDAYGEYFMLFLLFVCLGIKKDRLSLYLLLAVLFYFLVFNLIGHKEYRFILPIMALLVLFAAKGVLKYPSFIHKKHFQKQIYGFLAIVTVGFSASYAFYFYSFQPARQYCDAFQFVGEQEESEVLLVASLGTFFSPGYTYLHKNIPVGYFRKSTFNYFMTEFQTNNTYIIIPESEYIPNFQFYQDSFLHFNITLVKIFHGTHPRFDEGMYVFKNNL
ncbi:MAG: glycosyltransferase family 39 protein [Candidatus Heimdallarchaeota archaeon]